MQDQQDIDLQIAIKKLQETEKKCKELYESNKILKSIFKYAPIGMAVLEKDGRPEINNQSLRDLLGYSEAELQSMTFAEFTHPDDVEKDVQQFEQLVEGGIESYSMEKRYITKQGQVVWAALTVTSFEGFNGNKQLIGMASDITERKQIELELQLQNQELQEAIKEIKTLKGIIPICYYCHNIRDDEGAWSQLEAYLQKHSDAEFSHGICPSCLKSEQDKLHKK